MEIKGEVKVIGTTETVGAKGFKKRDLVITDNSGKFAQYISVQLTGDRCDEADKLNVGDMVTVSININGREWTSPTGEVKYFNSLIAWKIVVDSAAVNEVDRALGNANSTDFGDLPF